MTAKELMRLRRDVKRLVSRVAGVETLGIGKSGNAPVVVVYIRKEEIDESELRSLVEGAPTGVIFEYTTKAVGHGVTA